jgi:hypothetical protein
VEAVDVREFGERSVIVARVPAPKKKLDEAIAIIGLRSSFDL